MEAELPEAPQASPFWGGTIYVKPPFQRTRSVFPGAFGFKSVKVKMQPSWVGQTLYFVGNDRDAANLCFKRHFPVSLRNIVHDLL